MDRRGAAVVIGVLIVGLTVAGAIYGGIWVIKLLRPGAISRATVAQRVAEYGPGVDARLGPELAAKGLPAVTVAGTKVAMVVFKAERELHLYIEGEPSVGADAAGRWRLVKTYSIQAASGGPGPKLREGDKQVPEGAYGIESLNPNSRFHLSLRVAYPSTDDVAMAKADGRDVETLGNDIMIHGGAASIGCLAMGDPAIEELFVVAARAGGENVEVIIAPRRWRKGEAFDVPVGAPGWLGERYARVAERLTLIMAGEK